MIRALITDVEVLSPFHKRFTLAFEPLYADSWSHRPGQFVMLTVPMAGEVPISICSSPTRKGFVELTVREVGRKTGVLHRLSEGDVVGIRGPFGNGFPVERFKSMNVMLIAGGLGMAPLRSLLWYVLDRRELFGEIYLLYGTKSYQQVLYKDELKRLSSRKDVHCLFILDKLETQEDREWTPVEGLIPDLIDYVETDPERTCVAVCGPPVAYRFIVKKLLQRGFPKGNIFLSLERRMECGQGRCGNCQIGYKFTCKDGPVFSLLEEDLVPGML